MCRTGVRFVWLPTALALAMLAQVPRTQAQTVAPVQRRDRDIGQTVAERVSARYRFERLLISSADGAHSWRVNLGIPKQPPPAQGYPAFWMLDGNAALLEFDEVLLEELAEVEPHLLVFVGYDNQKRVDMLARTRDYTPVAAERMGEDEQMHLVGGGASAFLDALEQQIRPQVARHAPTDAKRQTLWGHSFGGLFTLHALYSGTAGFQTYASGSPSLWWGDGYLLGEPERRYMAAETHQPARLILMLGGRERQPGPGGRDRQNPRVAAHQRCVACVPEDAVLQLSQRLRQLPGLQVEYREFAELSHGPMLRASLLYALHAVCGIADHSGLPPS
jgi:predicted alpha/beta superfamily hydrolase